MSYFEKKFTDLELVAIRILKFLYEMKIILYTYKSV
jgi:hypothetical protein